MTQIKLFDRQKNTHFFSKTNAYYNVLGFNECLLDA